MSKRYDARPGNPSREMPEVAPRRYLLALLAGVVVLTVATPLIPSEAAVPFGTIAPLSMLWCLLLAAWSWLLLWRPELGIRWGWIDASVCALVSWQAFAAALAVTRGNGRQSLNALWLWVSYGIAFFLLRQLVRTSAQARGVLAMMIALAVCLSAHAYYQYFVSFPQMRAEYAKNSEQMLAESGISTDPASPQRRQFENRLQSVEPLASFALTNSLAGFLAPWLVAALGVLLIAYNSWQTRVAWAAVATAAFLAGCLLLTKSRTGILAAGGGIGVMLIYGRQSGPKFGWKAPAIALSALIALALAVVVAGGLDVKVLSEAPKSVLYRLEYWQATSQMIAEHFWFGVGPGNFQDHYSRYKLPGASETVADPHNFLLEIWATAGAPAIVLLGLVVGIFVRTIARSESDNFGHNDAPHESAGLYAIYSGGFAGPVVAFWLGLMVGYPLETIAGIQLPIVWLLGIPAAAVCLFMLHGWSKGGSLTPAIAVIALLTLGANLLAAGAASFPGVFISVWVLAALALKVKAAADFSRRPSRPVLAAYAAAIMLLLVACLRTEYRPVLMGQMHLGEARARHAMGDFGGSVMAAQAAADADPWSPDPWRILAELELQNWLQSEEQQDFQAFAEAADRYRAKSPSHYLQYQQRGDWYLQAWRKSNERKMLDESLQAYERAVHRYPNGSLQRAQLAWAFHLAGDAAGAAKQAEAAYTLDRVNAHLDQKLENQRLSDPYAPRVDAKQIVNRLRNKS